MRAYLPLNGLRAFEAVARQGSFTRAAAELGVTQAAISHQVKGLEHRLGVALFRRSNRAVQLTEEGQRLYPVVHDSFDRIAETLESQRARARSGALTVSVMPSLAAKWLVPRLSRWHAREPEIDLRISATERVVDLGRDGVDVAIRFGDGRWPGVEVEHILEDEITPVCTPTLAGSLARPEDLAHVTLLHETMLPLGAFPVWDDWLRAAGVTGVDTVRGPQFSHTHMLLQAAIDGQGVALGQLALAADDIAAGRLVAPFALRIPSRYAYFLVMPLGAGRQPKVSAFRAWVRDEMDALKASL